MGKRIHHDHLAKQLLCRGLERVGEVRTQHEVNWASLYIDVVVRADPERLVAERGRLGVLGRMLWRGQPCLFEPYSQTPRLRQVESCIDKQRALGRESSGARRAGKWPGKPPLWILSPGWARTVIATYELRPMRGWPRGFFQRQRIDAMHLVVLSELPRTRNTLYLRLLGTGRTVREAAAELKALPPDSWEWMAAGQIVLDKQPEFSKNQEDSMSPEDIQMLADRYREILREQAREEGLEQGREQGREQGHKQGLEQGLEQGRKQAERATLLRLLTARFGSLPPPVVRRVRRARHEQLGRWIDRILTAKSLNQVFAKN